MEQHLITPAREKDMPEIEQLARRFDLDLEDISWQQFLVARKKGRIIGFGRLRPYPECAEAATVAVIEPERNKGVGSAIVRELVRTGPPEIYVTCVIPGFFSRLGFRTVKQYPAVLRKKVDFCKLYDFKEDQIFVMKIAK